MSGLPPEPVTARHLNPDFVPRARYEAVLAERQQAQEAWVDCAGKLKAAVAERQQAIDERDATEAAREDALLFASEQQARCEQAIDALREIAQLAQRFHPIAGYQYDASPANIARAALLNLGETTP